MYIKFKVDVKLMQNRQHMPSQSNTGTEGHSARSRQGASRGHWGDNVEIA